MSQRLLEDWEQSGIPIQEKSCKFCGGDVAATPWRGWTAHCLLCGRSLPLRDFYATTRRVILGFDQGWLKGEPFTSLGSENHGGHDR